MLRKKNVFTLGTALVLGLGSIGSLAINNSTKVDAATRRTIMSKSIVYNQNGSSTGKKISTYKSVNVYGNKVTIKGKTYYQIGNNKYVRAVNIDGTSRTIYHNAYIYNNKGKHNRVEED
ncbi:hypothetical protein J2Z60_000292 [Lactobacillus colini]|uniref:S-layer protein C-terminal domain-containing protein n=1 Tax=Lactobacillus colini TaxID=1819254 RepID=A0ABS4MBS1_9LACO|nr:SLAP domain-containing protein [Lactobacillus colini]MBP2057130.1 hypothetical protein [Lactobacillus colini]